jgi:hypothetical protein
MPTSDTTSESTQPVAGAMPPHQHDPIAEQPPMLSNLAYSNAVNNINLAQQNAVANQQALNEMGITVTGKVVNFLTDTGIGIQAVLRNAGTDAHPLPSATVPSTAKS